MDKKKLREKMLSKRRGLGQKYVDKASLDIFEKIIEHDMVKNARSVMIYCDFDNEVKTGILAGWLMYHGKDVSVPLVYKKEMFVAELKGASLIESSFGALQPKLKGATLVEPEKLELVITPGVAFDRERNRLGYGFGYYDSFFKEATHAARMGIAYDFQVVKEIPVDAHDEKLDIIITPDEEIV